jgi:hypothetical protein
MLKESSTRTIFSELSTFALSELFDHSVGDMLFTIDEVQKLIDML